MEEKILVKTSLTLNKLEYAEFKKVCKINNSDASKEIRKMISNYIKKNQQLVQKLKNRN